VSEGDVLALIVPLLIPALVGRIIVWAGLVNAENAHVLSKLFLYVFIPPLIVTLMGQEDFADLADVRFILAALVLTLGLYGGLLVVHAVVLRRPLDVSALAAFAGTKFNAVIIGVPVMLAVLGHRGIAPSVILIVMGYFTILPLTLVLADVSAAKGQGDRPSAGAVLFGSVKHTATDPLVLATLVGLVIASIGVTMPGWLHASLEMLGKPAVPVALIAVGMSLSLASWREEMAEIAWMSVTRVVVAPALAVGVAKLMDLSAVLAVALVVGFALPTAQMVFPLCEERDRYANRAAGIISVTTMSMIVIWPIVLLVADRFWPGVIGVR
jgi:malonate transporter